MSDRVLKFRVYAEKGYYYSDDIGQFPEPWMFWRFVERHKLTAEQFIGLRDKNGKEIYEGDTIRIDGTKQYEHCIPKPTDGEYIGVFTVTVVLDSWGYNFDWEHVSGYNYLTHIMGDTIDDPKNIEVTAETAQEDES